MLSEVFPSLDNPGILCSPHHQGAADPWGIKDSSCSQWIFHALGTPGCHPPTPRLFIPCSTGNPAPSLPTLHSRAFPCGSGMWGRNAELSKEPGWAQLALPTMPACLQGQECCPTWSWEHPKNQHQAPLGTCPAAFHGNSFSFGGLWVVQRGLSSTQGLSWSLTVIRVTQKLWQSLGELQGWFFLGR